MLRVTLAVLLFTVSLCAQFRAGVQGVVTDSTGGVVANAKVTLTNNETQRAQETRTSGEGFYRFSGLPPGTYKISVEQPGFQRQTVESIRIQAEELQGQNVTLSPGEITQTVTVSESAVPALQTENANVARSIQT